MSTKKVSIGTKPTNKPAPAAADAWVESRSNGDKPEAMKRLTIDVPESLHRAIKAQCAMRGTALPPIFLDTDLG
jgi:hypothetical protein